MSLFSVTKIPSSGKAGNERLLHGNWSRERGRAPCTSGRSDNTDACKVWRRKLCREKRKFSSSTGKDLL